MTFEYSGALKIVSIFPPIIFFKAPHFKANIIWMSQRKDVFGDTIQLYAMCHSLVINPKWTAQFWWVRVVYPRWINSREISSIVVPCTDFYSFTWISWARRKNGIRSVYKMACCLYTSKIDSINHLKIQSV